jgi:hypothetical protein
MFRQLVIECGELEDALADLDSVRARHRIAVLMSPEGRFLECIDCRLQVEFAAGKQYNTILKQFESQSCSPVVSEKAK